MESLWERLIKKGRSTNLIISVLYNRPEVYNERLKKKIATDFVDAVADKGTVILSNDELML